MFPYTRSFFLCLFVCVFQTVAFAQTEPYQINVGEQAPNFTGVEQNGNSVELYQILENSPAVVMFYRGAWCKYCNKHLSAMEDSIQFITEKGGVVLAITPEQPESIEKTIKKTDASFKIIHDKDLKIMNAYHVTYEVDDAMMKKYKRRGIDVLGANKINGANLPVPATYIVGQDKKILYSFYDPDYTRRATVGQILENL